MTKEQYNNLVDIAIVLYGLFLGVALSIGVILTNEM